MLTKIQKTIPFSIIVILVLLPHIGVSTLWIHVICVIWYYLLLAASWNLLMGFTGLYSFGHTAFASLGGYTSAIIAIRFGAHPLLGLILGGVVAAVFSFGLGVVCMRIKGFYLALVTWAFAEIVNGVARVSYDYTGGTQGLRVIGLLGPGTDRITHYYIGGLLALGGLYLISRMVRSRWGLYFRSIRNDELASQVLGVNTVKWKVVCFAFSGLIAGIAGAFYASYVGIIDPSIGSIREMGFVMLMVILGGMGTLQGPVIGVIIVVIISNFLRGKLAALSMLFFAILMIIIVRYFSGGVMQWAGIVRTRWFKNHKFLEG
jgi:branched-chain amino acid transport system permease protein